MTHAIMRKSPTTQMQRLAELGAWLATEIERRAAAPDADHVDLGLEAQRRAREIGAISGRADRPVAASVAWRVHVSAEIRG